MHCDCSRKILVEYGAQVILALRVCNITEQIELSTHKTLSCCLHFSPFYASGAFLAGWGWIHCFIVRELCLLAYRCDQDPVHCLALN